MIIVQVTLLALIYCLGETRGERLFLTPLIKQNRTEDAIKLSKVVSLPNAPTIESYSGYFTVNEQFNSNMFFWFFPAFKNADKAPVVLWLAGGPGGSDMREIFYGMGPLRLHSDMNVTINPNSWTQEFSTLFVDNPVRTGFSFTDDDRGMSTNENQVADNLYEFLRQFFDVFSDYRKNDFYISGVSYAGKYVPSLGYKLMIESNVSDINFKGVAIGNGLIDTINMLNTSPLLKSLGLIDSKQEKEIKDMENEVKELYRNKQYLKASKLWFRINVNTPEGKELVSNFTGYDHMYNLYYSNLEQRVGNSSEVLEQYLNLNETKNAIHAEVYETGDDSYDKLLSDVIKSVEQNFTALIDHNYKVLLFVGNLDNIVGVDRVNAMLENPDWKYYNDYYNATKVVWKVNKGDYEVAGYAKYFSKFTMLVVRNAGHSVNEDKPRESLDLIKRFIYNIPWDQ